MKWTVLTSLILCSITFLASLSFLAVSCFNLASTENLFPVPGITEWRQYLIHIIVITVVIMLLAICSCWGATRRNGFVALAILLFHIGAVGVCIFYSNIIYNEVENCQEGADVIKNRTLQQFAKHRTTNPKDQMWVPDWLDSVQKQSPSCCGIVSYEDWREFWPENIRQVPTSCCRNDDPCVVDFDQIEWPKKPSDYIKNDEGCAATMSKNAARRVQETLKFLIVLMVLLVTTVLGLCLQFVIDYWTTAGRKRSYEDSLKPSCFSWARVKFQRKAPATQQNQNDPNGNADNANIDLPTEVGSYSFTYLQQLKQQQSDQQPEESNDSQPILPPINNNNPKKNKQISYAMPQMPAPTARQQEMQPNPPQTYTYEVLPENTNMYLNKPDLGSSQSLPEEQQPNPEIESNNQRIPLIFPDDTEKQNLKQLLRFGRRHRRHRKTELDPDQQQ